MLLNDIKRLSELLRSGNSNLRVHVRITIHQNSRQQMLWVLLYASSGHDFNKFDGGMTDGKVAKSPGDKLARY